MKKINRVMLILMAFLVISCTDKTVVIEKKEAVNKGAYSEYYLICTKRQGCFKYRVKASRDEFRYKYNIRDTIHIEGRFGKHKLKKN